MSADGNSKDIAERVKKESYSLLSYLYSKKEDLVVAAMALHCAYVAAIHALKESTPSDTIKPLLQMLRERDDVILADVDKLVKKDERVGIA